VAELRSKVDALERRAGNPKGAWFFEAKGRHDIDKGR
jgi:hypothetical protein